LEIELGAGVLDVGCGTGMLLPEGIFDQVICHTASRQRIDEFHRSMGGAVAHDTIPDKGEVLREAGLVEVEVRDEPGRYLAMTSRLPSATVSVCKERR